MLELKDFTFTPKLNTKPILEGISFQANYGESIALTGASGSGKSTLLQAIAGFIPDLIKGEVKGEVYLDGHPLQKLEPEKRLHKLGYISSQPHYQLSGICSTVREEVAWSLSNLGVNPDEMRIRTEHILQTFNLQNVAERHPQSLSSGQQQRLIIASVLILEPPILLLDEPAAFLDNKARHTLLDYILRSASSQRLIIWASSNLEEAAYFPRWLQLDKGKLVGDNHPHFIPSVGSLKAPWTRVLQDLNLEKEQPITNWPVTEDESIDFLRQNWRILAANSDSELQNTTFPKEEAQIKPSAADLTIKWQNISFSYDGKTPTLNDVTLTLQAPDCVAFCGTNGAGKTTLAQMSNGLLRPQQGALLIDGHNTSNTPSWQLASQVGFIFHNVREQVFAPDVWSETAFGPQNLGLTAQEVGQRCHKALELTHLLKLKNVHPYELSNAQLRRLTWASVLAMHTRAIVMDEPNAALDEESQQIFVDMLRYLREQRKALVILITHNMDLVSRYCQKIVLLDQGKLVDFGNTREVLLRHKELPSPSAAKFARALKLGTDIVDSIQLKRELQASSSSIIAG